MSDPCFLSAVEQSAMLRGREISAVELLAAHLDCIARVNPSVNAIVALDEGAALTAAKAADAAAARGEWLGPLHGLPLAVKDIFRTKGLRTTYGSPIYRDFVPDADDLIVARERAAGAVILGKTNTPEFARSGHGANPVYGVTRNPYDLTKSTNGSSAGAAAALAAGMVPLADGSDIGGSLRSPASWCNVVGFRPTPGRVHYHPAALAWFAMDTPGPMARTVEDAALFMGAIAGPDSRCPLSIDEPGSVFAPPLARDIAGVRIAWSSGRGHWPIDPAVETLFEEQRTVFEDLGCHMIDRHPELPDAMTVYRVLQRGKMALERQTDYRDQKDLLSPLVRADVEEGLAMSAQEVWQAEAIRSRLWRAMQVFFETADFLVWPVNQILPFAADDPGADAAANYDAVQVIPVIGLPAISVPSGFTPDGMPCGIQIIGPAGQDRAVLELAFAYEQATGHWRQRPRLK